MTDINELKRFLNEINCDYSENEPMSLHTSFKIGGSADLFLRPVSAQVLKAILEKCGDCQVPYFIVGSGSNLLVRDFGIKGAVIYTGGLSEISYIGGCTIKCDAGAKLSRLCGCALENSLTGIEFAWGIPGTAGGAAYMNAGAYGGEMRDILINSEHISKNFECETISAESMRLGYRKSIYQKNNAVITSITVELNYGEKEEIRSKMDDLMQRRKSKQPLEMPSAGSIFKRPNNNYAGTVIEQCGLKGFSVGGAQISEKHAGFIVNTGGATCSDVLALIEAVQQKVFDQTGIELECEVRVIK